MQTNTIPIENTHELLRGALSVSTFLMAALSDAQRESVIHAIKSGANLVLEISVPDTTHIKLCLVEREGKRSNVAGLKK